jgi:hypothetical protein
MFFLGKTDEGNLLGIKYDGANGCVRRILTAAFHMSSQADKDDKPNNYGSQKKEHQQKADCLSNVLEYVILRYVEGEEAQSESLVDDIKAVMPEFPFNYNANDWRGLQRFNDDGGPYEGITFIYDYYP